MGLEVEGSAGGGGILVGADFGGVGGYAHVPGEGDEHVSSSGEGGDVLGDWGGRGVCSMGGEDGSECGGDVGGTAGVGGEEDVG